MTIASQIPVHPLHAAVSFRRCGIFFMMAVFLCLGPRSVRAQNTWPIPSVCLYDCNVASAGADNAAQRAALNSASKQIMIDIPNDTTNVQMFLFSYGFADTTSADMASSGAGLSFPDSGRSANALYDFIIASKIVGKPGGYTLTVSLLDGRSYVHVADGTSAFTDASAPAVASACAAAVNKLLPLPETMHKYWTSLKSANPLLTINPRIDVAASVVNLPLNGRTDVAITAVDCDGQPIANRQLALDATKGSFAPGTVQTDNNGKASVVFNAGKSPGYAILNATLVNPVSILYDSLSSRGSTTLVVGVADVSNLWGMDFDFNNSYSGYNDKLIRETEGTRWKQKNFCTIQHARGRFIGTSNDDHTELHFNDSTLSLSGIYFSHEFLKETYTDITGKKCPETDWSMGGNSWSYAAETNDDHDGEADVSYDPTGLMLFALSVPYTMRDAYGYEWYTDGKWENGKCKTDLLSRGTHFKLPLNTMGGVAYFGQPPIHGLSILPWYTAGVITGYSIALNNSYTGYASDGSFYVMITQCSATITPVKKTTAVETTEPPMRFSLAQNYPNPFNPTTRISFSIGARSFVTLKIFDVMGREAATLVSGDMAPGIYSREWNAASFSSGIYFYRLQAGSFSETKKLILMR
jgi:hypothetical protein